MSSEFGRRIVKKLYRANRRASNGKSPAQIVVAGAPCVGTSSNPNALRVELNSFNQLSMSPTAPSTQMTLGSVGSESFHTCKLAENWMACVSEPFAPAG